MEREDYLDPACPLCGRPGETETARPVPMGRVLEKLAALEAANDREGAGRHLRYWLAEAEQIADERAQLSLNNELMGHCRMRGEGEKALAHAARALELVERLGMEETITAGTTWVNAGTVREAFGDPEGGLRCFERARENYERSLPPDDPRLGGLYNNMGLALTALARYREAEDVFRRALSVMARRPGGEPERAVTLLNLADAAEAELGPEAAEPVVAGYLDEAAALLDADGPERNAAYAFFCEKCAPVFGYYGYFAKEAELRERARRIYAGGAT